MKRSFLAVAALCGILGACGGPQPLAQDPSIAVASLSDLPEPGARDYQSSARSELVRPLDVLEVSVFNVAELTRTVRVGAAGTFDFPLIGAVQANGRSLQEIGYEIESRLQPDYVRTPDVTVQFAERPGQLFTIGGEVENPGQYPVVQPLTLMEAMAIGGGKSELSKLDEVLVFREVDGQRFIGVYDLSAIQRGNYPDPQIYSQDIIMVGESSSRRLIADILLYTQVFSTPLILFERLSR